MKKLLRKFVLKNLKKYLKVISLVIQEDIQYRINFITSFLCVIFPLFAIVLLWKTVYQEVNIIGGYDKSLMVSYYIISALIGDFICIAIWYNIKSDILEGSLSNFLIKPINYRLYNLSLRIGTNFVCSIFNFSIIVIFSLFFLKLIFFPQPIFLLLFFITFIFSFILSFELTFVISISSFWLKENEGLNAFIGVIIPVLIGSVVPLNLFPNFIVQISNFLPFKYILFVPVNVYLMQYSIGEILTYMLIQVFWIVIIHLLGNWVWSYGLKKYESVGV